MYTEAELEFEEIQSYKFSQLVLERSREAQGLDIPIREIRNKADRWKLMQTLLSSDQSRVAQIGMKFVDTGSVHDVAGGTQPLGDFYFCDMLSELYRMEGGRRILDFGCSNGRIIRNLAAFYNIEAFGCDPRSQSIEFAKQNFDQVEWFVSNEEPPIINEKSKFNSFDMVFAISVWSHFSSDRAKEWFDEMARIIVPGGSLIFSTHGTRSIYHISDIKNAMQPSKAIERLEALRKGGYHFMAYGNGNDLDQQHWGMAFSAPEWFEKNISENWNIDRHLQGCAMQNQDVYCLTRK